MYSISELIKVFATDRVRVRIGYTLLQDKLLPPLPPSLIDWYNMTGAQFEKGILLYCYVHKYFLYYEVQ